MGSKKKSGKFVFRKHANIGAADAIEDREYLSESFVDNGELAIFRDTTRPECIAVGRTGSGKTALLEQLRACEERVIKIAPESLALNYISNNDVLNFFTEAGVDMDLFYRLLWRHVLAVEIIKERYHIVNEQSRDNFLVQLKDKLFSSRARAAALAYLKEWGESFWQETEYRVKEVTRKLEKDLGASVQSSFGAIPGIGASPVSLNAEAARKLTEEQKAEVVRRGQSVVDSVQVGLLTEIIKLLEDDILDDKQKKYFITIDRLDEGWVNDNLRYRLIRALLETVRDFNNGIENVKIIVAVREDLLDRVFRYVRSPGYQEEKYKSMYLPLVWSEEELEVLLDKRVSQLVKEQYTSKIVRLRDLLPTSLYKDDPIRYLLARTMLRPRDAIMFFNECLKRAVGKAAVTKEMVDQAELIYSENRLRALADEWATDYPNLIELGFFLRGLPSQFHRAAASKQIEDKLLEFLDTNRVEDYIHNTAVEKFNTGDIDGFIQEMLSILFRVGLIGVKQHNYARIHWSYLGEKLLEADTGENAVFHIHPAFWKVLGVRDQ